MFSSKAFLSLPPIPLKSSESFSTWRERIRFFGQGRRHLNLRLHDVRDVDGKEDEAGPLGPGDAGGEGRHRKLARL
jgi:hypothetical protein